VSRFVASLPGPPKGKERPRASIPWSLVWKWIAGGKRGRKPIPHVYTSRDYQRWEDGLADQLAAAWGASGRRTPLDEPCSLLLVCFFPRPASRTRKTLPNPRYPHASRPDADNAAKAVQDAMQKGGLLADDSRVFDLRVVKWVCAGDEEPRIELVFRWGMGCTLLR
jgi:Holliday junction resolvase RusA-like endonuclease